MLVERTRTGLIVISALINGHLVTRKYYGFTLRMARWDFRHEFPDAD